MHADGYFLLLVKWSNGASKWSGERLETRNEEKERREYKGKKWREQGLERERVQNEMIDESSNEREGMRLMREREREPTELVAFKEAFAKN